MKKGIFVLFLVIVAIICCSSIVSAGFFDFLGGDVTLNGDLKENSFNASFDNVKGGSFITDEGIWNFCDLTCEGCLKIDLNNASKDDLKKLNGSLKSDNITLFIKSDMKVKYNDLGDESNEVKINISDANFTLEANTLKVNFSDTIKTRYNIYKPVISSYNITSGNITIPGNGITVKF